MVLYRRGSTWWTDFSIDGRRYRLSLKTHVKPKAVTLEKLRIAEAQSAGGLLPRKKSKIKLSEAADSYLTERTGLVSSSTIRLERDALKQVKRHMGDFRLGHLTPATLTAYIQKRKAEGIGNRTINIELGVVRKILKRHKLWLIVGEDYHPLPEPKDIGRALTPEQELKLFTVASSRPEWSVAFWVSLVAANTTAGGVELRNLPVGDVDIQNRMLYVCAGKNRFRLRAIPLNRTAMWAMEHLMSRAQKLGATSPDHYLIPHRVSGKKFDPTQPPSRWAWRTAWRALTKEAGLPGLRPHDLRHHAVTKLAESPGASEQTIMSIAGHVSREMLEHYSHIRQEAKRKAVEGIENATITSRLVDWEAEAKAREDAKNAVKLRKHGRDGQI